MSQPRLLILTTDLRLGGTPTVVREMALRLRDRWQVQVACLDRAGAVAPQILAAGIPVTPLNAAGPGDFRAIVRLRHLIRRGKFDVIYSLLLHANVAAALANWQGQGALIQSIQTAQPYPRWHWPLQGLVQSAARAIVVPSASVRAAAINQAGIAPQKIVVIANALDSRDWPQLPLRPTGRSIGFIGRLDPIKNLPQLLQAMALLDDSTNLHIFGEGSQRPLLQSLIAQLHLGKRVTLHGATTEPHLALAQMDVLVLPSRAEGFGLVLIEAMAAGVPVIATEAPGIRDVVIDHYNGLLCPLDDAAALARIIRRLLNDVPLREKLRRGGWESVARHYSWHSVLPRYEQLFLDAQY